MRQEPLPETENLALRERNRNKGNNSFRDRKSDVLREGGNGSKEATWRLKLHLKLPAQLHCSGSVPVLKASIHTR